MSFETHGKNDGPAMQAANLGVLGCLALIILGVFGAIIAAVING